MKPNGASPLMFLEDISYSILK